MESENIKIENKTDFDFEAEKLFKKFANLGVGSNTGDRRFRKLDPIYQDPDTKAIVYVGGYLASDDLQVLQSASINRVLNCTSGQKLTFANKDDFVYKRFNIAAWESLMKGKSSKALISFINEMIEFVNAQLAQGKNVLVHCLAGAHRAGTAGVIILMSKLSLNSKQATALAKKLRPIINPIGRLKELLRRLDIAVSELNVSGYLKEGDTWYRPGL